MSSTAVLEIPDLWPNDVALTDIVSPAAILRYQAGQLRAKTRNLLEADVEIVPDDKNVKIEFYVIAPALDRYRVLLFSVTHRPELVYPVTVIDECLCDEEVYDERDSGYPEAADQKEFTRLLSIVLASPRTRSVIQSLLARSNEDRTSPVPSKQSALKGLPRRDE